MPLVRQCRHLAVHLRLYIGIYPSHPPFRFEHSKPLLLKKTMDMYQRIAFIIVVVSGAAILAYCAADNIFYVVKRVPFYGPGYL